jgi:hypothetical protein
MPDGGGGKMPPGPDVGDAVEHLRSPEHKVRFAGVNT